EMIRVVIETTTLRPDRPAAAAEESWVIATDLAEALARTGTPFHQAHQIVGRFVLESLRSGKKPGDWTPEEMRNIGLSPELLDPRAGMQSREIVGGTGPQTVARALEFASGRLKEDV